VITKNIMRLGRRHCEGEKDYEIREELVERKKKYEKI
jgi:hypothetical protein